MNIFGYRTFIHFLINNALSLFFYLFLFLVTLVFSSYVVQRNEVGKIQEIGTHRLEMSYASLRSHIDKYAYLPFILTSDKNIHDLLAQPADENLKRSVNIYLQNVNEQSKARTIYLLDKNGVAIASSNWNTTESFIGNRYVHRPYFQDAVQKGKGFFYGVGETSRIPGCYLSQVVLDKNRNIKGIIVVKITLLQLESIWKQKNEDTFVVDENGIIFLSSHSGLRWKTLGQLTDQVVEKIKQTKQYDLSELQLLHWHKEVTAIEQAFLVKFGSQTHTVLQQSLKIPDLHWEIFILSDMTTVHQSVSQIQIVTIFGYGFFGIFILYLKQRKKRIQEALFAQKQLKQAYDELELKVSERTQALVQTNEQLQKEIKEREKATYNLKKAQDELIQATKLAVIGQMAAGITHELNQPLAAMRPLVENMRIFLERQQYGAVERNIEYVLDLVNRMAKITSQLRAFSKKTKSEVKAVCVQSTIQNVLLLLEQSRQIQNVEICTQITEENLYIDADDIRIEQVLLNLCRNALDAMSLVEKPRLVLQLAKENDSVVLSVSDNGSGIEEDIVPHIFEPFFTTKEGGHGLGLGLAISQSIINDYGGEILFFHNQPCGTIFQIHFKQSTSMTISKN